MLLEPILGLLQGLLNLVLILGVDLVGQLLLVLDGVPHGVDVVLEGVLGVDLLLQGLVLVGELLGVADHRLDLLFGEAALVVCDGD